MRMNTRANHSAQVFCLGLLCLMATLGCQTVDDLKLSKEWQKRLSLERDTIADKTPVKMVTLWADEVYYTAGKKPTRGLGGRIYFYNRMNEAIKIDGSLTVYGFDGGEAENDVPDKKFVFTGEQFANYEKESALGPSYNVWLPWDAVGGPQKAVDLVPFFISENGKVLVGDQASHLLPGSKSSAKDKPKSPDLVRQVHHQTEPTPSQKPRLQTTTIPVSPETRQRMQIKPRAVDKSAAIGEPPKLSLREQFQCHQQRKQSVQTRASQAAPKPQTRATKAEEEGSTLGVPATYQASSRFGRSRYQVPRGPAGQSIGANAPSPQPRAGRPLAPASSAQIPPTSSEGSWQFVPADAR